MRKDEVKGEDGPFSTSIQVRKVQVFLGIATEGRH